MFPTKSTAAALCLICLPVVPAHAGSAEDGYRWLSTTTDILGEGILWNDRFGDGEDRYKTGGMTQSWVFPEHIFSDTNWIDGHASGIELQGRGFIATPDNTAAGINPDDRPFAQYVGVGAYLRVTQRPLPLNATTSVSAEDRAGIEIGYTGEPLPLFDIQDAIHGMASSGNTAANRANAVDNEWLVNLEGSRTWRFHADLGNRDMQWAPFLQASAGMREISARLGTDIIIGSSLEGRTWNRDPAIGALIPGGSMARDGLNWMTWIGGDIGYVGADAFLDGGFDGNSPSVNRTEITFRARAGLMVEYADFALAYSLAWMSPEFEEQPEGQLVGALSLKYRF